MVIKFYGEDIVIKLKVGDMDEAIAGELVDEETDIQTEIPTPRSSSSSAAAWQASSNELEELVPDTQNLTTDIPLLENKPQQASSANKNVMTRTSTDVQPTPLEMTEVPVQRYPVRERCKPDRLKF